MKNKNKKLLIYEMGNPDLVTSIYPGGIDTKIYLDDKCIGFIQEISFGYRNDIDYRLIGGSITFIMLNEMEHLKWLGRTMRLALISANESGKICTLYNADIRFDSHEQFGVSIDDVVMKMRLDFTLVSRYYEDYIPLSKRAKCDEAETIQPSDEKYGC